MGAVKDVVNTFPTTQPPFLQFSDGICLVTSLTLFLKMNVLFLPTYQKWMIFS